MLFNSFRFLWLFPLIFLGYWGTAFLMKGRKVAPAFSNALLLAVSYGLYAWWNPVAALFLLAVTAVTFLFALLIEKEKTPVGGGKKWLVACGVVLALLPLITFKYYGFLLSVLTDALSLFGMRVGLPGLNWAMPLGISFFTFQAVGYLLDVYYKRIDAERDWWDYMLFVAFFPQIAAGPISKYVDLMPQIKAARTFDYGTAVHGGKSLLYGMFLKVVVADSLAVVIDPHLDAYGRMSGMACAASAVLYSFQIYNDFAGYSLMAVGVGELLGFRLINNFNRPYFAASVTEFWRRWHISLTRWLTDYVYIPLGGSRCSKAKNYRNIAATFLVSGIWHGANWTFIVWGLMHGVAQVAEKAFGLQKCGNGRVRPLRIACTFLLVTAAWVFFRMPTLRDGLGIFARIFTDFLGGVPHVGDKTDWFFALASLSVSCAADWAGEYRPRWSVLGNRHAAVRWPAYVALACSILLCGVFDAGSFIYVDF